MEYGREEVPQGGTIFTEFTPDMPSTVGLPETEITEPPTNGVNAEGQEDGPELQTLVCRNTVVMPSRHDIRMENGWRSLLGLPLLNYEEEVKKAMESNSRGFAQGYQG